MHLFVLGQNGMNREQAISGDCISIYLQLLSWILYLYFFVFLLRW